MYQFSLWQSSVIGIKECISNLRFALLRSAAVVVQQDLKAR